MDHLVLLARRVTLIGTLVLAVTLAGGSSLDAEDWPQLLGPERNGVYRGVPLSEKWPAGGPRVVWRKPVGQGFAAPVVVEGRVLVFHRIGSQEVLDALDARTGASAWRYEYPTRYKDDFGFDEGPRSAPVAAQGLVHMYGAEGQLHTVDLATGRRVWSEDAMSRFKVAKGFFGAAGSPLVDGGRLLVNVGGANAGVVAFDAKTGTVLWTATSDQASYSSGVAATIAGRRHAIFLTRNGILGLDPVSGSVLFQRPWRARAAASVNVATPMIVGDLLFVSAEYGPGAGVMRIEGRTLVDLWSSDEVLSNHYATSVVHNGTLYGYHGRQEFGPSLRAVDFKTGKVRWSEDQFRAGSITLAGERLLVVRERGEMLIAPASPDGFRPVARAQVLTGTVRAYPAIADGFVYLRNDDTLVCLDLRR